MPFTAEVFQNQFLTEGAGEVHAIVTVTAGEDLPRAGGQERVFGIVCDVSGSMEGSKLAAAVAAVARVIQLLPPSCHFFVVAGADGGQVLCPLTPATPEGRRMALERLAGLRAFGGTRFSQWLEGALGEFQLRPGALCQALLLTDGQNDPDDEGRLQAVLARCAGVFQCDCRGVGTEWQVPQLRSIAQMLLGTVDLIPTPAGIEADFRSVLDRALAKTVREASLRVWCPRTATVRFVKQVSPALVDLTARARELQGQVREYPTGAWAGGESRDFHLCVDVAPGRSGEEMLAARLSIMVEEGEPEAIKVAEVRVLATWTGDATKTTQINRAVAHYTGQAELAASIQDGLAARAMGKQAEATALLGRAVQMAEASGNEATVRLLRRVVDVNERDGTVRLRAEATAGEAMALDTRSTRTARIERPR